MEPTKSILGLGRAWSIRKSEEVDGKSPQSMDNDRLLIDPDYSMESTSFSETGDLDPAALELMQEETVNQEDMGEIPRSISLGRRASMSTAEDLMAKNKPSVTFSEINDPPTEENEDDEALTREELLEKLQTFYRTLATTEFEYAAERALRRKTERTVVKLARSITKKTEQLRTKDQTLLQLAETVSLFEKRLQAERHASAELEELNREKEQNYIQKMNKAESLYTSTCAQYQSTIDALKKEHALAMDAASAELLHVEQEHKQQLQLAQSKYRSKCRELDAQVEARVSEWKQTNGAEVDRLRAELKAARAEASELRTKLASLELSVSAPKAREAAKDKKYLVAFILAIFMVMISFSASKQERPFATALMDSLCAPAMPGTQLQGTQEMVLEAPWWAPADKKNVAFGICGERVRSRIEWRSNKKGLTEIVGLHLNGNITGTVFSLPATTAEFYPEKVRLTDKNGNEREVSAFWKSA